MPKAFEGSKRNVVICADTVVAVDDLILGKPADDKAARHMLETLSGRTHDVFTGVVVALQGSRSRPSSFVERTQVTFHALSTQDIDGYIATGEPFDKAGGYG